MNANPNGTIGSENHHNVNSHQSNSTSIANVPGNSVVPSAISTSKALMLTNGSGLYKVFSTESVLNLLHCLYCRKPYKDPRLLFCGHTYCLPCLIQMNRYSTIRCIKCNSLQTVTSQAVDTLPKNLFVADIQCIPTVEIDRGATYKETLKSLEDLKTKLIDFSDKFDQSEQKLFQLIETKKKEVSDQITKLIDQIKYLEIDFYNEIDEFKNNRLAVLRSAPPEFKETNENLLQFVNKSLEDMMRPDIKEEDVKEIYNRCEEHRRLWNETEIIFNSNYAIGEMHFQLNENAPKKELIGAIIQKLPQKLNAQRTAKGPVSISEFCPKGEYIIIENTSKRNDINMTNWLLTHCVGSVRKISFRFPDNFVLKSKQSVKLWASSTHRNTNALSDRMNKVSVSPNRSNSTTPSPSSSITKTNNQTMVNGFNPTKRTSSNGSLNQKDVSQSVTNPTTNEESSGDPNIENELILKDIESWNYGSQEILIRLENEFGEEKASFKKN